MKEENILKFFIENGFRPENGLFLGSRNYAFLPFNGSLIVGRYSKKGLLVEGIFKDSSIRSLSYNKERGVLLDVKEDPTLKDLEKLFKGRTENIPKTDEKTLEGK